MSKAGKLSAVLVFTLHLFGLAFPEPVRAGDGPVVAMDSRHGRGVRAGEIFTNGAEPTLLVGRNNTRIELSPYSVGEYDDKGGFRLLRGSAVLESREECSARTTSAQVDFVGRALLSYDYKEHSTSSFVLEGEARIVNPQQAGNTLRLMRFQGATMVAGDVLPQLVRSLDLGALDSWLSGFAWPADRRHALLQQVPGKVVTQAEVPRHLASAKLEDYFSSIDTADEFHQPNYYDKKFADPDTVVAEAKSNKSAGKSLSPEEAALISLPDTKIDLGFDLGPEIVTSRQKAREVRKLELKSRPPARRLASVAPVKKAQVKAASPAEAAEEGDPEVNAVLSRLRSVRSGDSLPTRLPASGRGPASTGAPLIPDPVYDYSRNF